MARHNIPHFAGVVSAGAFPEFEKVGDGKDHAHKLAVLMSIGRVGNDPALHGPMAALLFRNIIDEDHEKVEDSYRRLVCGLAPERKGKRGKGGRKRKKG